MSGLGPTYGETPLSPDDEAALHADAVAALGGCPTKAAVYDLEQAIQAEESTSLLTQVLEGDIVVQELLVDHFVRELHGRLYGGIWT